MIIISILILISDLLLKTYAVNYLKGAEQIIIPKILGLCYVENHGAAWGILSGARVFFIFLTVFFLILVIVFYIKKNSELTSLSKLIVVLIFSGAFGNLIDRIHYGYVRDMINILFIDFPIFNIADTAIVIGAVLLTYESIFCTTGILELIGNDNKKQ